MLKYNSEKRKHYPSLMEFKFMVRKTDTEQVT